MGTKAASNPPRSPPPYEREDDDRSKRLASISQAVEVLHVLDRALACADDAELGRLASQAREGERALETWAREVETFRASKQLFEAGIVPDLVERPRGARDELVLTRVARALDQSPSLRFFWEALAFMVGFVLSLLVT
jgi:hypothetical protein